MDFSQSKKHLLRIFQEYDFSINLQNKRIHASRVIIDTCKNGTQIVISFPGYKAHFSGSRIIYDYRVDIIKGKITTALSHANIITDIFNKIQYGKMPPDNLQKVLIEFSKKGEIDLEKAIEVLSYNPVAPAASLISRVATAHGPKMYNQAGNSFDLTVEELFTSIRWIVLQEDINYPIERNFEGRKMPFSRYLETIFVTQYTSHRLEEVIKRALAHFRPQPWTEMDYSFRDQIK